MSVNAKFIADFTQFDTAVKAAEIKLKDFESGANKVGPALNRMVDQFSGRKLIQEGTMMARVLGDAGSIARLTGNELHAAGAKAAEAAEKMRRMGVEVPPGLQRIADAAKHASDATKATADAAKGASASTGLLTTGIGALAGAFTLAKVASFGADLVAATGALQDFHERTDISVEGLQRFKIIAEQSGSSLDAVATAVFQMGRRIAGDDKSAAKAVAELGLNFAELRAMRPEEAFNAVGKALGALDDPMKRSQLGAAIFGRSVDDLIPTLKHLNDELGHVVTLSAAQVKAVDALGDAFVRFKASLVPATVALVDNTFQISRAYGFWSSLLSKIDEAPKVMGAAKAALEAMNAGVAGRALQPVAGGDLDTIQKQAIEELNAALAAKIQRLAEAKAAADKFAAANKAMHVEILKIENVLPGVTGQFGRVDDAVMKLGGQIRTLTKDLSDLERHGWTTSGVMRNFAGDLEKLGEHVDPATIHAYAQEWAFTGPLMDTLNQKSSTFGASLSDLASSMAQLAQVSGDSFGGLLKDIAQAMVGLNGLVKAMDAYSTASTTAAKSSAAFSVALLGVGYAYSVYQAGVAHTKSLIASLDSYLMVVEHFQSIAAEAERMGISLDAAFNSQSANDFRAAVGAIDVQMASIMDAVHGMGAFTQEELQAVADQSKAVFDYMEATGKYSAEQLAKAWEDYARKLGIALGEIDPNAIVEIDPKAVSGMTDALSALDAEFKRLSDSVKDEAPERVMGVIEKQTRGQMAALQKQSEAQAKKLEADAKEAAAALEKALASIDPAPIHVKIVFDVPKLPTGRVSMPTTGQAAGAKSSVGSGAGGTAVIEIDGRVLAEVIVPQIPGAVKRFGLR